jgi:hypothetical protein
MYELCRSHKGDFIGSLTVLNNPGGLNKISTLSLVYNRGIKLSFKTRVSTILLWAAEDALNKYPNFSCQQQAASPSRWGGLGVCQDHLKIYKVAANPWQTGKLNSAHTLRKTGSFIYCWTIIFSWETTRESPCLVLCIHACMAFLATTFF